MVLFVGMLSPGISMGAGFAIAEQSVSGLGVGFAGSAASAEDASTIWHNPAGMAYLEKGQLVVGLNAIFPTSEFKNQGTVSLNPTGGSPDVPTEGSNGKTRSNALVPNFYYSNALNDKVHYGIGVGAPFGLKTEYADGWVGRYLALESDLKTLNINPSLSYRVSDELSVGFGINFLNAEATLSSAVDFGLAFLATGNYSVDVAANRGGTKYDGRLEMTGDDWGVGYNFGLIWEPKEGTRLGLSYRSDVEITVEGDADFTVGALDAFLGSYFPDQGGSVYLELPAMLSVSIYHEVGDWTVLADVTYTWWERFKELNLQYETGDPAPTLIPENWKNTWRFSVGFTYQGSDRLLLRFGTVYDGAAVPDEAHRSPRIPDADRYWGTLGFQYQLSEKVFLDVAYAHVFIDEGPIDNSEHTEGNRLIGETDSRVDILSAGLTYQF